LAGQFLLVFTSVVHFSLILFACEWIEEEFELSVKYDIVKVDLLAPAVRLDILRLARRSQEGKYAIVRRGRGRRWFYARGAPGQAQVLAQVCSVMIGAACHVLCLLPAL
jgi:hypothetical protein